MTILPSRAPILIYSWRTMKRWSFSLESSQASPGRKAWGLRVWATAFRNGTSALRLSRNPVFWMSPVSARNWSACNQAATWMKHLRPSSTHFSMRGIADRPGAMIEPRFSSIKSLLCRGHPSKGTVVNTTDSMPLVFVRSFLVRKELDTKRSLKKELRDVARGVSEKIQKPR